jgi:hypothetical protein
MMLVVMMLALALALMMMALLLLLLLLLSKRSAPLLRRREAHVEHGGPAGGNGGRGGNVWAVADDALNSLIKFRGKVGNRCTGCPSATLPVSYPGPWCASRTPGLEQLLRRAAARW